MDVMDPYRMCKADKDGYGFVMLSVVMSCGQRSCFSSLFIKKAIQYLLAFSLRGIIHTVNH